MQKVRQQLDDTDVDLIYLQDEFKQFKERKRIEEENERLQLANDKSGMEMDDDSEHQDSMDNLDTFACHGQREDSNLEFSRQRLKENHKI